MAHNTFGTFDLTAEANRFPPNDDASRRRAEILIKTKGLRVVLVTMLADADLHEHVAPAPITIQAVRGRFDVTVGDEQYGLAAGRVIGIAAGVRHSVHAAEEGAFLLTIGGTGAPSPAE